MTFTNKASFLQSAEVHVCYYFWWIGCASSPADPVLFDNFRPPSPRAGFTYPVCFLTGGKVGLIQASLAVLFMPRKWERANGRACLRFAEKVCFGLCWYSGWPPLLKGPGRRDFTKPTQPGRIWAETRQQPLTPRFTRESKESIYIITIPRHIVLYNLSLCLVMDT